MIVMASRQIIPAVETYLGQLAQTATLKRDLCGEESVALEKEIITKLTALNAKAYQAVEHLRVVDKQATSAGDAFAVACAFRDLVVPAMASLRAPVDEMETLVPSDIWPLPTYGEMTYKQ